MPRWIQFLQLASFCSKYNLNSPLLLQIHFSRKSLQALHSSLISDLSTCNNKNPRKIHVLIISSFPILSEREGEFEFYQVSWNQKKWEVFGFLDKRLIQTWKSWEIQKKWVFCRGSCRHKILKFNKISLIKKIWFVSLICQFIRMNIMNTCFFIRKQFFAWVSIFLT